MIVTYSMGAHVRLPWSPLGELRGRALGHQLDYRGSIGSDLVQGVELAVAALEQATTRRRVLIVLGDGNDTVPGRAPRALADLRKRAIKDQIELYAMVYISPVSDAHTDVTALVPDTRQVNSVDGINATLAAITSRISNRHYVTFELPAAAWDGRDHDLAIALNGNELEPVTMPLPRWSGGSTWAWSWRWWNELAVGVVLLALLVGMWRWRIAVAKPPADGTES